MVKETQLTGPDYKRIYSDIVKLNFPDKLEELNSFLLKKAHPNNIDIIKFNNVLFGKNENASNRKLRVYSLLDIQNILEKQAKLGLNNTDASKHFKISRNTLISWRKLEISKR